jgi:predicted GIY-YIG superfamily endonuclease
MRLSDEMIDGPHDPDLEYLDAARAIVQEAAEDQASRVAHHVGAAYAMSHIAQALHHQTAGRDVGMLTTVEEIVIGFASSLSGMAATISHLAESVERRPYLLGQVLRRPSADARPRLELLTEDESAREAVDLASKLRDVAIALEVARQTCRPIPIARYRPHPEWRLIAAIKAGTAIALYYWFDAADRLLYVGISSSLAQRQAAHAKKSSWSEFAVRCSVARFPTREEAELAEKAAIEQERPLFNVQHNEGPEARQRLVEYLLEHGRTDLLTPAVSRG